MLTTAYPTPRSVFCRETPLLRRTLLLRFCSTEFFWFSDFSDANFMPLLLVSKSPLFMSISLSLLLPYSSLPSSSNSFTEKNYSPSCVSLSDLSPQPQPPACTLPAAHPRPPPHPMPVWPGSDSSPLTGHKTIIGQFLQASSTGKERSLMELPPRGW